MADLTTIEIGGLKQLSENLLSIPAKLSAKIMREALHAFGDVVAQAAEASAPRQSGALADDIIVKVHVSGDLSSNYVLIGPGYDKSQLITRRRGKYAGRADTSSSPGVYGMFVEIGHGPPGSKGIKASARMSGKELEFGSNQTSPQPWLGPAWNQSAEPALETFVGYVRAGLEAVALELNK